MEKAYNGRCHKKEENNLQKLLTSDSPSSQSIQALGNPSFAKHTYCEQLHPYCVNDHTEKLKMQGHLR